MFLKTLNRFKTLNIHQLVIRERSNKITHVLDGDIPPIFQHIRDINRENMKQLEEKYLHLLQRSHLGGGERGIERHVVRNKKMLPRDRLKHLLDEDSPVLEISVLAGFGLKYGDIPCGGVITVIGKIHGLWCMLCINDATVKGGSIFPITVKKQLRMQQIAEENHLPMIYLVDSGGAYLPLQAEIFNEGGKAFYNQAVMSSKGITQIALVCGSCTAGAAYVPSMADESVILHKTGSVYLGGPPLVFAATGERVTSEQLGGATLHCEVSGGTDHFAVSEEEALMKIRDVVATLNIQDKTPQETPGEPPKYEEDELNELFPAYHRYHQLNPKYILARILDGSRFHEFKQKFAQTITTGFGTINNHLAGFLASNGTLSGAACLKASHFVQLCCQRNIPIVYLQHFEGACSEPERADVNDSTIKGRAQLLQTVSCASVPAITITTGGVTGSPLSHTLGSLATGSRFHYLLPNSRVGYSDPISLFRNIHNPKDLPKDQLHQFKDLLHQTNSFTSEARLYNDGVILPRHLRDVITNSLSIFKQSQMMQLMTSPDQTFLRM